jgi:hypothetical protein
VSFYAYRTNDYIFRFSGETEPIECVCVHLKRLILRNGSSLIMEIGKSKHIGWANKLKTKEELANAAL